MQPRQDALGELALLYTRGNSRFTELDLENLQQELMRDDSESGSRYKHYRQSLLNIRDEESGDNVSRDLINIFKEMVLDALIAHGMDVENLLGSGGVNLCVTGSLSAGEATAYSDIDCLMIIGDSVGVIDREKIKAIMVSVANISEILFMDVHQFCMDPFGLSVKTLTGTVDELCSKIKSAGSDAIAISVINSISVLSGLSGEEDLERLKAAVTRMLPDINANYCFNKVIMDFCGPKWGGSEINIKNDILRPLDFLIQGFRISAGLSAQEYDSQKVLLKKLCDIGVIDQDVADLIGHLKKSANDTRKTLHLTHAGVFEWIGSESSSDIVAWTAMLRGSLQAWLQQQKNTGSRDCLTLRADQCLTGGELVPDPTRPVMHFRVISDLINDLFQTSEKPNDRYLSIFKGMINNDERKFKKDLLAIIGDLIEIRKGLMNSIISGKQFDVESEMMKMSSTVKLYHDDIKFKLLVGGRLDRALTEISQSNMRDSIGYFRK